MALCGDGDFGAILSKGPGKWKLIPLWRLSWSDILQSMEVTNSDNVFVPSRKYDCPAHLISTIRDYDLYRESHVSRPHGSVDEFAGCQEKMWKLITMIRSCIAAERLELEGRDEGSPPVSADELLRLPGPIFCPSTGVDSYVGFRYRGANRKIHMSATQCVKFGPRHWDIGLLILWSEPDQLRRKKRECILQMRAIQVTHKECTGDNRDVYGLATSGDMIQIHRLTGCREVQSSPMFLLTAEGVSGIWPYMREIIHQAQLRASRPDYVQHGPGGTQKHHQEESLLLTRGYGFEPDGTKQKRFTESISPAAENAVRNKEINQISRFRKVRAAESDDEINPESRSEQQLYWQDDEPEPYSAKKSQTRRTCQTRLDEAPKQNSPSKAGGVNEQEEEDWDIL